MIEKQVIDQMIYNMEPGVWHGYLKLWSEITKATLQEINFARRKNSIADQILKKMVKRNLVTIKYTRHQHIDNALIQLADRGIKLREDEVWVNNTKKGIITEKPERWVTRRDLVIAAVTLIGAIITALILKLLGLN